MSQLSQYNQNVSIIITAYNKEHYLKDAINSALAQTYPFIDVAIIDDGSTDNTENLVRSYGNKVRYIYQQNSGVSSARNLGILSTLSPFIVFLDGDDVLENNMVSVLLSALNDHTECAVAYGGYRTTNQDGHLVALSDLNKPSGSVFEKMCCGTILAMSGCLVRRPLLAQTGIFDTSLSQIEDRDFWMRLAYYYNFIFVPQYVVDYRSCESSLARNFEDQHRAAPIFLNKMEYFISKRDKQHCLMRALRKHVYAHAPLVCAQDAYIAYENADYITARKMFVKSICMMPSMLRNRGIIAMLVRSYLPFLRNLHK